MTNYPAILQMLVEGGVEFILVGGAAATAHGSARLTKDVDVVYRRTGENISRLVGCLSAHKPYLRGAPPGLPFQFDVETVKHGLNFTLDTDLGPLDLLGEIAGAGTYERLFPTVKTLSAFGIAVPCIDLVSLIRTKRAAGRPKDLEAIAELEALLEEQYKQ